MPAPGSPSSPSGPRTSDQLTVLVTCVGATTGISVIKALRKQKEFAVKVVGTDAQPARSIAGSSFCDEFVQVPLAREASFVPTLVRALDQHHVDLLVPIVDSEVEVIAAHQQELRAHTHPLVSSVETVRTCNDKWLAYQAFTRLGVPTFRTLLVDPTRDPAEQVREAGLGFPLFAKPRYGISSRDAYSIPSAEDLTLLRRVPDAILQEMGTGPEHTVDVMSDGKDRIVAVPRLRMETRSGISYQGRVVQNPSLSDLATRVCRGLGIYGPANVQIMGNDDHLRVIEINPRFSAGLPLTIASGVNTPLLALRLLKHGNIGDVPAPRLVSMHRYWEEVFYDEG